MDEILIIPSGDPRFGTFPPFNAFDPRLANTEVHERRSGHDRRAHVRDDTNWGRRATDTNTPRNTKGE